MTFTPSSIIEAATGQMFAGLDGVLVKAAAFAKAKEIEEGVMLGWRAAPDMFPLSRQVQIATELPARGVARLAGAEMPSFDDSEASIEDMRGRIKKARAFIASISKEAVDANPDAEITVPVGPQQMTFTRRNYLLQFILPNHYFHVTATYMLLRTMGVDIGKRDFLAVPQ